MVHRLNTFVSGGPGDGSLGILDYQAVRGEPCVAAVTIFDGTIVQITFIGKEVLMVAAKDRIGRRQVWACTDATFGVRVQIFWGL